MDEPTCECGHTHDEHDSGGYCGAREDPYGECMCFYYEPGADSVVQEAPST